MKVKIITIHDPDVNHGSTLQSCSTFNFIKNLGYDVEIIDYRPNYISMKNRIKKCVTNLVFIVPYKKRRAKIDRYFKKNAKLTSRYHNFEELSKNPPVANVYITGSDVIWNRDVNPEGNDRSFYLGFVKYGKKISYASSMGRLQTYNNIDFIVEQIRDFRFISVREEKSRQQLLNAGIPNVECVMDPVFLMDKEYYLSKTSQNHYGNYILVYYILDNETKRHIVEVLKSNYNYKIIGIGGFKKKSNCDLFIRNVGVEDFLTLISNAKYIVTDSFHCVSFSIIFNVQFCYIPHNNLSIRSENLLNIAGLENRIITSINELDKVCKLIDYKQVNEKIKPEIHKSRKYLVKALKIIEEETKKDEDS